MRSAFDFEVPPDDNRGNDGGWCQPEDVGWVERKVYDDKGGRGGDERGQHHSEVTGNTILSRQTAASDRFEVNEAECGADASEDEHGDTVPHLEFPDQPSLDVGESVGVNPYDTAKIHKK